MHSQTGVINKLFITVGTFRFRILQWLTGQWLIGQMFLTPQMADQTRSSDYFNTTAYCWHKFFFDLTIALTFCLWAVQTKTRSHWNMQMIGHIHWCWGNRLIEWRMRAASAVTSQVLAHVELLAALARQTSNCFLSALFAGVLTNIYIQRKTVESFYFLTDFLCKLRPLVVAAMKPHNEQRKKVKSCKYYIFK